jgi:fructosamine-3-kinase
MTRLAEAGAALLGGELVRSTPVAGGDLSQILRISLKDGREAIVKGGPAPQTEAAMLRAIAAAGAPAPAVLAASDEALAIEVLTAGGAVGTAWPGLASALATLHSETGEHYGWPEDYAFGPLTVPNGWTEDWPRFWAERRLLVHIASIPPALARRLEPLADDIANRLPQRPPPALLHGDLWGGNVLVADGKVSGLIDPACYHGHCEVDLAMLALFDRPNTAFYDAYPPLETGHAERLPVYQLWPALVHLRLFGGGYRPLVERLLSASGV